LSPADVSCVMNLHYEQAVSFWEIFARKHRKQAWQP